MQLVRFAITNDESESGTQNVESWGIMTADGIRDFGSLLRTCPTMLDLISDWESLSDQLDSLMADAPLLPIDTPLLSPVPECGNVICIGLNYRDHAIETGAEIPTEPVVFSKLKGTLCAHGDDVPLPAVSHEVDFEAELVVVIGKTAQNVPREKAAEHIFGYMCGHDVSARDWQKGRPGGQWLLGKSFPHFAPVGPCIVPSQFVANPHELNVRLRLNGELMQDSSTKQLIFNTSELIAHLSQCTILRPGDLIFTGTPPGVGAARTPPVFLKSGDVCEVEVEGLGVLRNRFV